MPMSRNNQLELRNQLAQALARVINSRELEEVVRDLKEYGGELSIDLPPFAQGSAANFRQLLVVCKKYDQTELLFRIVKDICNSRREWADLEELFIAYQQSLQSDSSANDHRLSNAQQLEADHGRKRRVQLLDLAKKHPELTGARFSEVINQAFNGAHPGMTLRSVYPSIFSDTEISSWDDLITSTSESAFELDQRFLDALQQVLDQESPITGSQLSSLIVMILKPLADNSRFSFRAYFCRDEATLPEQWIRVDAKSIEPSICIDNWIADLQRLMKPAIREAQHLKQAHQTPLLLEIFLPSELLNEDVANHIKLENLNGVSDPLWKYYPVILRSSRRFQFFHEGEGDPVPNPLSRKWPPAKKLAAEERSSGHLWWHDLTPASGVHSPKRAKEMSQLYDALRVSPEYFGFKRISNLPSCPKLHLQWINELISASPAIALWWRSGAKSQKARRQVCFEAACPENGVRPFGLSTPQAHEPHPSDPFTHPYIQQPLRLFHALASVQHHGQIGPGPTAQAFREMVILVDCVDRWPPPLDVSPARQPDSGQPGLVIVDVDEIHISE
jgi:hypothetical protein